MQKILVLQSLWAMQDSGAEFHDIPIEEAVERAISAGFDGMSVPFHEFAIAKRVMDTSKGTDFALEALCVVDSAESFKPILEFAMNAGVRHINLQPNIRANDIAKAISIVEEWYKEASAAGVPLALETHRGRLTSDLELTARLARQIPSLRFVMDLSHYVIANDWTPPIPEHDALLVVEILDRALAFHGRIASAGQVQIGMTQPASRPWVQQFRNWWAQGFDLWKGRAAPDSELCFTCELGPQPYAIADEAGRDDLDRWSEALRLKAFAREIFGERPARSGIDVH